MAASTAAMEIQDPGRAPPTGPPLLARPRVVWAIALACGILGVLVGVCGVALAGPPAAAPSPAPAPLPPTAASLASLASGPIVWSSWSRGLWKRCLRLAGKELHLVECNRDEVLNFTVATPPNSGPIRIATMINKCVGVRETFLGGKVRVMDCGSETRRGSFIMPSGGNGEIRWAEDARKCIGVTGDFTLALHDCPAEPDKKLHFTVPTSTYSDLSSGKQGGELPEMYGKVNEKTIWGYWYNPVDCPSSARCKLPAVVQLCVETIERNSGGFTFRLLHLDEVDKYVSRFDLPLRWYHLLHPAQQKDSLMSALLARYGGVAIDLTAILFEPLDDWWEGMVNDGAAFRGYWYAGSEVPVWFMMARRESVFRIVANRQLIAMGDEVWPYHLSDDEFNQYLGLGDGMVSPVLCEYDHRFCSWFEGERGPGRTPDWAGSSRAPLSFGKIIAPNPEESVQLPFSGRPYDMPVFDVHAKAEEWAIFKQRFLADNGGGGGGMKFVKMFQQGGPGARSRSRQELLEDKTTFFYHWLCLAGHPETRPGDCAEDRRASG